MRVAVAFGFEAIRFDAQADQLRFHTGGALL